MLIIISVQYFKAISFLILLIEIQCLHKHYLWLVKRKINVKLKNITERHLDQTGYGTVKAIHSYSIAD